MNKNIWDEIYEKKSLPWLKNPIPFEILNTFIELLPGKKVLDYGGGDGLLAVLFVEAGLDVTISDVSSRSLNLASEKIPNIKTILSEKPSVFVENREMFDGILCWGVFHHIDESEWSSYLESFYKTTLPSGYILIGGHSMKDIEFESGYRISPTTNIISHAIDGLGEISKKSGFELIQEDYFPFIEAFTGKERIFKYFLLKRGI